MANYTIAIRNGSTGSINTGNINQVKTGTTSTYQNLASTSLGRPHSQTRWSRGATSIDVAKSNTIVPTKAINRRGKYVTLATGAAAAHSTITLTLSRDTNTYTILRLSGTNRNI